MKSSYPQSIAFVLRQEGGYTNDPRDPGGPTNWGITIHDARMYWKKDASAADVKAMPLQVARDIYESKYWAAVHGDDIAAGLDLCTFDSAVNSGTGRAWKWLSAALGKPGVSNYKTLADFSQQAKSVPDAVKAFCAYRLSFLHGLRTWSAFGKGWGRRVSELQALGVRMALQATGKPKEEIKKALGKEVAQTTTKNTADVAKTTVATGGTGTGAYQFWEWDFTHLAILAVAIGVIGYFVFKVIRNNQQITAYNDQIKQLEAASGTNSVS